MGILLTGTMNFVLGPLLPFRGEPKKKKKPNLILIILITYLFHNRMEPIWISFYCPTRKILFPIIWGLHSILVIGTASYQVFCFDFYSLYNYIGDRGLFDFPGRKRYRRGSSSRTACVHLYSYMGLLASHFLPFKRRARSP